MWPFGRSIAADRIAKLDCRPGDILVIEIPYDVTPQEADAFRERLLGRYGIEAMLLYGGARAVAVIPGPRGKHKEGLV
jgi:hypothetical protein